jgi:hypothetical protein
VLNCRHGTHADLPRRDEASAAVDNPALTVGLDRVRKTEPFDAGGNLLNLPFPMQSGAIGVSLDLVDWGLLYGERHRRSFG